MTDEEITQVKTVLASQYEELYNRCSLEKRVQILSLLLYKDKQRDFIENYIPYKIDYKLKNFEEYKKNLDDKIKKLNQNFKFTKIYLYINDLLVKVAFF